MGDLAAGHHAPPSRTLMLLRCNGPGRGRVRREDGRDHRRGPTRAVAPSMLGAPVDDRVALLEHYLLARLHDADDLAVDDGVDVDGGREVHADGLVIAGVVLLTVERVDRRSVLLAIDL